MKFQKIMKEGLNAFEHYQQHKDPTCEQCQHYLEGVEIGKRASVEKSNCALCEHKLFSVKYEGLTADELAEKEDLAQIEIRSNEGGIYVAGYICKACTNTFATKNTLNKIVKRTRQIGNSSGVVLPLQWLGKKVIVYKLDDAEDL